ncbi:hypothetical protein Cni_G17452 [Canna indica]|uniref:Uncharacterized protein n=1 Tax=Canna indica TaxID=4628 RepID=A0AAQ3QF49_9LILI|nr:hypothetical protein Cni_G17452 [Canna indica]
MRTMIDLGSQRGSLYIIDMATAVNCTKDVRFRCSFRSLIECMVPCSVRQTPPTVIPPTLTTYSRYGGNTPTSTTALVATAAATTTVIDTIFGFRCGRVHFCLHDASSCRSTTLLLLEFTVLMAYLAKEM